MKKFLLSFVIVLSFISYVLYERFGNVESITTSIPVTTPVPLNLGSSSQSLDISYKDGVYVGDVTDAFYGNVQVKATISGGKISNVQFVDYPQDRHTSVSINAQAMPLLKTEAITAQKAQVDIVSGATQTSLAFQKSLQSALTKSQS